MVHKHVPMPQELHDALTLARKTLNDLRQLQTTELDPERNVVIGNIISDQLEMLRNLASGFPKYRAAVYEVAREYVEMMQIAAYRNPSFDGDEVGEWVD